MSEPTNPFTTSTGKNPSCMEMLQLILDGQVTSEQREYFRSHMDHCIPCFKSHQVDMAIKELLQSKCCGGGAPSDLVQQIKNQIERNSA